MYKLFLDDIREPIDAYEYTQRSIYKELGWIVVRSYDEFIDYILNNGLPKLISFDHDLADEHYNYLAMWRKVDYNDYKEKTGYECVKWLCDYCIDTNKKLPECIFHTQNTIGYVNMSKYIENFKRFYD